MKLHNGILTFIPMTSMNIKTTKTFFKVAIKETKIISTKTLASFLNFFLNIKTPKLGANNFVKIAHKCVTMAHNSVLKDKMR